ncbi:MAG: PAS domain S-box protein [Gammaproteobacteria bacterium]|nr:PAS domain S-box protein [Gammaproteobacteria bacterium]
MVTRMEAPHYTHYRTVSSSHSPGNPFPVDQLFAMDIGTFCETVIKARDPLLVPNAREDERFRRAPEIQVGMVSYLGLPVLWPDGSVFGTICVLDDKTNWYSDLYQELLKHCRDVLQGDLQTLARLGNELEEQKAHLSELFARVPEAVVMVDADSRITRVNPEFTRIFGYTAEEAIGRRIKELITPEDRREEADSFVHRLLQSGEIFAVETVRRHKNGTRIPVSLTCVPVVLQRPWQHRLRDLPRHQRVQAAAA